MSLSRFMVHVNTYFLTKLGAIKRHFFLQIRKVQKSVQNQQSRDAHICANFLHLSKFTKIHCTKYGIIITTNQPTTQHNTANKASRASWDWDETTADWILSFLPSHLAPPLVSSLFRLYLRLAQLVLPWISSPLSWPCSTLSQQWLHIIYESAIYIRHSSSRRRKHD